MSLYERLGGQAAISAAVDLFYRKVIQDNRINRFFRGVELPRLMSMQRAFLTLATGGPSNYTGRDMGPAHERLVEQGLDDSHFDAVAEHLGDTLRELGVPEQELSEVLAAAGSLRDAVLGRAGVTS